MKEKQGGRYLVVVTSAHRPSFPALTWSQTMYAVNNIVMLLHEQTDLLEQRPSWEVNIY
jgi:hypothetical protein